MYADFYSLTSLPFQLTPDPRFYFGSTEHTKAMAHLTYGIHQGEGYIVVTGDVGAGKTTLVDYLLTTLPPAKHIAAKIVTTQLRGDDMLRMVAASFNLFREGADKATLLRRIDEFAARSNELGKRVLLVVDEAQNLSIEALEELRMLSNIIVRGTVPIQTVMLGQPQFRTLLARPELEQLRQRVTASYHLGPLNLEDTRRYIEHRLKLVGWKRDPEFAEGCFAEVFHYTGGIPRRINTLCSRLMLLGFLEEKHLIADSMVAQVADEMASELGAEASGDTLKSNGGDQKASAGVMPAVTDLNKRIDGLERTVNRHEQMLRRAFDLVSRFLERPER